MRRSLALLLLCALAACEKDRPRAGFDGVIELDQHSLGFEVAGRVAQLLVKRGDRVKKDQILARLDDTLERAQRPIREADLAGAEARLQLVLAGARGSEIRALAAQADAAATQVAAAEREYRRQQALVTRGASTQAVLDDLDSRRRAAQDERDAAVQRLPTLRSGSRPEEVRGAMAARDAARAAISALDERLEHYRLAAPEDGLILDVAAKEGEIVSPGAAVLLFARPQLPYVDIFVPVAEVAPLKVGQGASVRPDGDAAAYPARIEQISPITEYTPHYLLSEADRAALRTRVRVRIDDPQERLHAGVPCRVLLRRDAPP